MLVIPGSVGTVASLVGFTEISMIMPYWQLLGLHVVMMISLAATFTPVFTLGIGALPMHLYSHASCILGTLQQFAAAFGHCALGHGDNAAGRAGRGESRPGRGQLEGMQAAFAVTAAISLVVVVMAWLLPGRLDEVSPDAAEPAPADDVEDCEHGLEPAGCTC